MTALTVFQDVAKKIGVTVPSAVFSSTEREHRELAEVMNEGAQRIFEAHDWQLLRTQATFTGDGTTTAFDKPTGYDRMLKDAKLWSSRIQTPLRHVMSTDEWLELDVRSYEYVVGVWTLFQDQFQIKPAPTSTETVKFFYISNLIVTPSSGDNKTSFTADTDTFRLNERLLKLAMIWQWREKKGLPYAEDMTTYEDFLEQLILKDRGAKMIRAGRQRTPKTVNIAYPQSISVTP